MEKKQPKSDDERVEDVENRQLQKQANALLSRIRTMQGKRRAYARGGRVFGVESAIRRALTAIQGPEARMQPKNMLGKSNPQSPEQSQALRDLNRYTGAPLDADIRSSSEALGVGPEAQDRYRRGQSEIQKLFEQMRNERDARDAQGLATGGLAMRARKLAARC